MNQLRYPLQRGLMVDVVVVVLLLRQLLHDRYRVVLASMNGIHQVLMDSMMFHLTERRKKISSSEINDDYIQIEAYLLQILDEFLSVLSVEHDNNTK